MFGRKSSLDIVGGAGWRAFERIEKLFSCGLVKRSGPKMTFTSRCLEENLFQIQRKALINWSSEGFKNFLLIRRETSVRKGGDERCLVLP